MYVGQWPIFHGPLILPYIVVDLNYLYINDTGRGYVPLRALALVMKAGKDARQWVSTLLF